MRHPLRRLAPALLSLCAAGAHAATAWDESASGDLSNNGLATTAVVMVPGENLLIGSTGRVGGVVDRDYFSFTLPAGWQLDTLTVLPGTKALGAAPASFIAVQAGPQVTVNPTGGSAAGLLGWAHYGENDIGTDILGLMGVAPGAIGFAGALPAGTYSFWIQDSGTGVADYRLSFGVSAVPEPATWALWLAGLGVAGGMARRARLPAAA